MIKNKNNLQTHRQKQSMAWMAGLLIVLTAIGSMFSASMAGAVTFNVHGTSEFIGIGKPGFIKVDGKGSGLNGTLTLERNLVSGELKFPLKTLSTGVEWRDKHMKDEYLEVKKYPVADLVLKNLKIPGNPEAKGYNQTNVPFTGVFTVHGQSRPLKGIINLQNEDGTIVGQAKFDIKMSNYGFRKAEFLGMKVEDDVHVSAHIEAKPSRS